MAEENSSIEVVSKENFIKDGKIYILGQNENRITGNPYKGGCGGLHR